MSYFFVRSTQNVALFKPPPLHPSEAVEVDVIFNWNMCNNIVQFLKNQ
nr:hypothetical protein [White spot syndrome virus]